ncbi:hypothetical protein EVAR_9910_1 [Eumeta japonica]|uniref:Uncharacterized protein n=1 Tax=Eumeta variegata TaxID=151549 RepID=A0A4C1TQG8_EUMVA|nr:hypothetical protein EVAR_9910_1 [Eumeta japonica]
MGKHDSHTYSNSAHTCVLPKISTQSKFEVDNLSNVYMSRLTPGRTRICARKCDRPGQSNARTVVRLSHCTSNKPHHPEIFTSYNLGPQVTNDGTANFTGSRMWEVVSRCDAQFVILNREPLFPSGYWFCEGCGKPINPSTY